MATLLDLALNVLAATDGIWTGFDWDAHAWFLVSLLLPLALLLLIVVFSQPLSPARHPGSELDQLLVLKRCWATAAPFRGMSGRKWRSCRPTPSPSQPPQEPSGESVLGRLVAAKRQGGWLSAAGEMRH